MMSRWNSLVVGGCNVVGLALLALSVTAGGSAVRAAGDAAVLDSVAIEPLMKLADVFQQRVAKIEASVAAITDSMTSRRIAAQELCVADESGAQTCITKAQLDALLKGVMQTAQADPARQATPAPHSAPAADPPAATAPRPSEQAACPEKCVAPEAAIAAAVPLETPPVNEPPASAMSKEAATPDAATVVKETATPEAASAAVTPATQPTADQQQAAAEALAVAEVIPTPRPKPSE